MTDGNMAPNAVGWWKVTGCGIHMIIAGVYLNWKCREASNPVNLEERVYQELRRGLQLQPAEPVLGLGDLNAHVSKDEGGEHSRRGFRDATNAHGRRMLRFLEQSGLYILTGAATPTATFTMAKPTFDAGGWRRTDREPRAKTLVDYALASADTARTIKDVHVYRSPCHRGDAGWSAR